MTQQIRAITFDVFGTLLEFPPDCKWMKAYAREVHEIEQGMRPYRPILDIFLDAGANWNDLILRDDAWTALADLRPGFHIALLSNAGTALGKEFFSRWGGLDGLTVIDTNAVWAYKPNHKIYRIALQRLGRQPDEVLHVAAHKFDLIGAKTVGLHTAFVDWPNYTTETVQPDEVDFHVPTLTELAGVLNCIHRHQSQEDY